MKRQIRNVITSFVVTAFAGIGLMAFGQSPCPCTTQTVQPVAPQPVVIQQTVDQTVPQTCPQPTVIQTVEEFVEQPVPQLVAQPVPCAAQTTACVDLCDLVKSIEKHADHLAAISKIRSNVWNARTIPTTTA